MCIDLLVLCASMGTIETCLLLLWNLSLLGTRGVAIYLPADQQVDATTEQLALLYTGLTSVNAVHAWAFFNMLARVGAVSSAVMKGLQLVLVFSFSVVFFCQFQSTQCFAWSKAAGVSIVAFGLLVYAYSTARAAPPIH